MSTLDGIYRAFGAYRNATGKQIHDLPAWVLTNVSWLEKIGINIGMAN